MKIDNQDINIDDLVSDKYMHKKINNDIYLSNYQIEVLNRYQIDPFKCGSLNDLIMEIEEVLEDIEDADDLEQVGDEISEFNYYAYTNK